MSISVHEHVIGVLLGITLNLYTLDNIDMLTVLSFAVHGHGMCYQVFVSYFFQDCFVVSIGQSLHLLNSYFMLFVFYSF